MPTDDSTLGDSARRAQPAIRQIFVGIGEDTAAATDPLAFERKLYVIRKRLEHQIDALDLADKKTFYVVSLSARTMVWKGMLTAAQLPEYFVDLRDAELESALALVHQRFSTNTFPSWPLAHPYRVIAHNGEINTLRGNINWMRAREGLLATPLFAEGDLQQLLPVIREGGSDTATFDNVLEFLIMSGRSLPHAMLMMIPEPWQNHESMDPARRAFYEYHSSLMEPWDGPAAMAFTDGTMIGAVLDRNGLRPSRYYVTKDDLVVMASEVGVLDIPAEKIRAKERLQPGKMFLVDTSQGRIVDDQEIKSALAAAQPYQRWLSEHLFDIRDLPDAPHLPLPDHTTVLRRQRAFGYTEEDLRLLMAPMAQNGEEATGSMGTDTALAVLSAKPQLLFDYFKQLFAQVTNPPLDAIREELITSMGSTIGPEGNLLDPKPESCRQIEVKYPVLSNEEVAKLRCVGSDDNASSIQPPCPAAPAIAGFRTRTLPMLFDPAQDGPGLEAAIAELCAAASAAIKDGVNILILSDRGMDATHAAIPSLLATAGVHHHLVREGARTKCALLVEAGDAREVHHCALLIGYGAGAVNPYLAFETFDDMIRQGMLPGLTHKKAVGNYVKALNKGILKVMSKMGISTLQSYCGAQIFEAIGLQKAFVDRYFTWTPSRIEGIGIDMVAEEVCRRHELAYPTRPVKVDALETGGEYQWRRDGEYHLFNPQTVFKLQHATRSGQYSVFKEYSKAVDDQSRELATLRGLMTFKAALGVGADPDRRGRAGRGDRQALLDRGDVVRLDQLGGARDAGHRHEPDRRAIEQRRRRRGQPPLQPRRERRLAAQRDQAGGLGPLRRDQRIPGQRHRSADQDGAGRQARRGRPAARPQGLPVDRQGALLDARRDADLAAAAPRHLLDRGHRAADSRPEERQPGSADPRQAGRRSRRRHGRGRRLQGARGRRAHLGPRRRHRRLAAHQHQARRRAVGAGPGRDAAGAADERPAQPHRRPGRRPDEDRPRRGHRGAARRRGVRLRHRAAGRRPAA